MREVSAMQENNSSSKNTCASQPVVRGIFHINKRSCDVLLTTCRIAWSPIQPEAPTGDSTLCRQDEYVELEDVFAVKVKRRRSVGQQSGGTLLGLTLFYCKHKGNKLKQQVIHLENLSVDHCEVWFKHIKSLLSGFPNRPKSLKVLVNPISHQKEAYKVYRDKVAPLFKLADIEADVTVTVSKGHALSLLQERSLETYDGVVCLGGDGFVAEVAHGLLLRAQMDAGRDTDSIFTPVRAALPLGVIAAGSADIVAYSVHGIRHPVTAALHIIMGHHQAVDVCSFSSSGSLLRFGFSSMFGFGARTLALAERNRWMPPAQRHEFAFVKALVNLSPEECELSFLPKRSQAEGCEGEEAQRKMMCGEADVPWQTLQGLFLNISIMAIPCICSIAPQGLAPTTKLDNGSMALIMVGNTSRSDFVKHLKRYSSVNNQFSFSFIETHEVEAVRVRVQGHSAVNPSEQKVVCDSQNNTDTEGTYLWNVDGDLLEVPSEVLIRVHPQLITLFGVNVEEIHQSPIKCSCI